MREHTRKMYLWVLALAGILAAASSPAPALAAGELMDVEGYPSLVRKPVELWSDGTRLAGDVFYPKATAEGEKLPTIVLCHGWGGVKAHLNRGIAPRFAAAGYLVLAFDYRGWGESDARLVVRGQMPEPDEDGYVTVKAQAIRQLVDPLDQQEDIDAAITFVEGEPHADASRIGIWGSSFGGGHVIWRAAHDRRVKAVAAQVGAMDQRSGLVVAPGGLKGFHRTAIQRARGEVEAGPGRRAPAGRPDRQPVLRTLRQVLTRPARPPHHRADHHHRRQEGALLRHPRARPTSRPNPLRPRPGRVPRLGHDPLRRLQRRLARQGHGGRDRLLRPPPQVAGAASVAPAWS